MHLLDKIGSLHNIIELQDTGILANSSRLRPGLFILFGKGLLISWLPLCRLITNAHIFKLFLQGCTLGRRSLLSLLYPGLLHTPLFLHLHHGMWRVPKMRWVASPRATVSFPFL